MTVQRACLHLGMLLYTFRILNKGIHVSYTYKYVSTRLFLTLALKDSYWFLIYKVTLLSISLRYTGTNNDIWRGKATSNAGGFHAGQIEIGECWKELKENPGNPENNIQRKKRTQLIYDQYTTQDTFAL